MNHISDCDAKAGIKLAATRSASSAGTYHSYSETAAMDTSRGDAFAEVGKVSLECGMHEEAAMFFRQAIASGTSSEIFDLLAMATFPGPDYRVHLTMLHQGLNPRRYLEIGVFNGDTLALAGKGTDAIGVDPAPQPAADRFYEAATTIRRETSDSYFLNCGLAKPGSVDLAFIDGLHHFDQVLRDFVHTEQYCHPHSVIVFHDTLPVATLPAERERASRFWCGDVWKIVPCLRHYRPDLTLITIPTFPSGITIALGLNPGSTILLDELDEATDAFNNLSLNVTAQNPLQGLPQWQSMAPNDPAEVLRLIKTRQSDH